MWQNTNARLPIEYDPSLLGFECYNVPENGYCKFTVFLAIEFG